MSREELESQLLERLRAQGPMAAREARELLGVSQPTFSRVIAALGERVRTIGRARAVRYAARRSIEGIGDALDLWRVRADATLERFGRLEAIAPGGYCFDPGDVSRVQLFDDLPWFLDELRPGGYLGRLIPRRHPELSLPDDVLRWSGDDALRYAARYGWNLPGAFAVGEGAYELLLRYALEPPDVVPRGERERRYPELARESLSWGVPGSSAAGEQPKFLATLGPDPLRPALVKFSPPTDESVGRRVADLLVCEHLAHEVLTGHGVAACRSSLLHAGGRVFLEVERFDRVAGGGRRSVASLGAIDAHFTGAGGSWARSAQALGDAGVIAPAAVARVRWLTIFGRLIRNSDMHPGNLAFLLDDLRPGALAPVYDMLPAEHAPRQGNIVDTPFEPPLPRPEDADLWSGAWRAALGFWERAATHPEISPEFREIAAANRAALGRLERVAAMLPGAGDG